MKKIIDKNIFKDLDNWAKKGGISGKDALSIIVNDFYDAVIKERKLEKFFYGIDEQILRNHQIMFLTQLFSGKLAGGFSEKHLYESHKDLIVNRGLNQFHFKIFDLP